jgi:glycosyltransferase involved in cell wall biosynthesis
MTAGFLSGALGGYDRSRRRSEHRRSEQLTATLTTALAAGTQKVQASRSARPSVSVILPFLDEERFLAGAVASVRAQTDAAWELLLVDDGSTDMSAATADELAAGDPGRIRVLRHPGGGNRGLPASRNLGLSEAGASLVAFIDADDRWEPFKLAEQVALFRRDPELTMVCGPTLYRPIGEGMPATLTPVLVDAPQRLGTGEFAAEMVRGTVTPPPPSNVMFRTTALRQAGGVPAGDSLYEDQRTFIAVSLIGPVLVSDRTWSSYTVRPDSLYGSLADDWVTRLRQQRDFHQWILRWATRRGPAGRSLGALLVRQRLYGAVRRRVLDGADAARGLLSRRT